MEPKLKAVPKAAPKVHPELVKYTPSAAHDILMCGAYAKMVNEGIIYNILPAGSLSSLFVAIQPPTDAFFKTDATSQIWFLGWFELNQILGRLCAVWVAKEHRQSKEALAAVMELLAKGVELYGEVSAITAQKKVVDGALTLGYNLVGKIQRMVGERWILYLRKDAIENPLEE
jgi:hypothetical protein